MAERLYAIRGATGAENTAESLQKNVCEMCLRLFSENRLAQGNFVSIQFTITDDLDVMNPAMALRKGQDDFDVSQIPLFCSQDLPYPGSHVRQV